MPTDYSANYTPEYLASLPLKLRRSITGDYNPGSEGIGGLFQNVLSPVMKPLSPISSGATGIAQWGARNPAYWKRLNQAVALTGGAGAAGAFGGGTFAGGAAGAGLGTGASASTVNPFAAGAGLGTNWASIGGSAAFPTAASIGAGAGATPALAGAGAGAGGVATQAGVPWYNSFLGQTALNTGFNLLGGWLNNRAIGNAQQQSQQQIADRIRQALAALSPEQIMALAQQFLPQMAAQMSGAGQTAIQAVREQAARTGQLEGPRALSFEAGTRAKLASDVQQRAFEAAFNTAGAQASAITGAPYTPIQPQTGIADAITNSINQAYMARALSQRPQYPTGVPYQWPGQFGGPY